MFLRSASKGEANMGRFNKNRLIVVVAAIGLLSLPGFGQRSSPPGRDKMYQATFRLPALVRGEPLEAHWMKDGTCFWYHERTADRSLIYKVDPLAGRKTPLLEMDELARALNSVLGQKLSPEKLDVRYLTYDEARDAFGIAIDNRRFEYHRRTSKVSIIARSEEDAARRTPRTVEKGLFAEEADSVEVLSPDERWFLGSKDNNLYLRSVGSDKTTSITTDGVEDLPWTVRGAIWSSDGSKVIVQKTDERGVRRLPIVHWLEEEATVDSIPYTKAGEPLRVIRLAAVDVSSRKQVPIDVSDDTFAYFDVIGWSADGASLIYSKASRVWNKVELLAADPENGTKRTILVEESPTFLGTLGRKFRPSYFDSGNKFLWLSERDGWQHIYSYAKDGTLLRQVTRGEFPVTGVVAVDEKGGWVYFTAHGDKQRPYDTHLYRSSLEGDGMFRLTEADGQHSIEMSPSKRVFLDSHSSLVRPPAVDLRGSDGALIETLSASGLEGLRERGWVAPEEFTVKAADEKTDLYGVLFKPFDFNPAKKYPVIDYMYNGPNRTHVPRTFLASLWPRAMAQLGCVVIVVDGRGTPERGKAFQDIVYGNFGRHEIPDHVATLKQLARQKPWLDLERVGVWGGSWGGYMTLRALLLAPDDYHVGVAYYPVADLYDHSTGIERYMGLPRNNKDAYEFASNIRLAGKLKGKLLLIAGTSDVNAPFSATMKMVDALIKADKGFDLLVVPEQDHTFNRNAPYIFNTIRRYFEEHLLDPRPRR